MDPLRLGVIGCGDVAQRDYLPEIHRLGDRARVVSIAGASDARVGAVAARFGIPGVFVGHQALLAESDCDAVLNLTPIQAHADITRAALASGRHVYSEKPLASSAAEAAALESVAAETGRVLVCAPSIRLYPQLTIAAELVAGGALGRLTGAHARAYGGVPPWHGFPSDPSQFFGEGGGPLVDMGVYPLHALVALLGRIRSVVARSTSIQTGFTIADGPLVGRRIPIEVPDSWALIAEHRDGVLSTIEANNVMNDARAPELEIAGLAGTVALSILDVSAPIELYTVDEGWRRIEVPRSGRAEGPDHLLGVEHLVDCVLAGLEPTIGPSDAIHVLSVIDAARRSAATGRVEPVA